MFCYPTGIVLQSTRVLQQWAYTAAQLDRVEFVHHWGMHSVFKVPDESGINTTAGILGGLLGRCAAESLRHSGSPPVLSPPHAALPCVPEHSAEAGRGAEGG